ncbi:transposase-like zinc-binding domain-containing protein [Alistipes indistinctus]
MECKYCGGTCVKDGTQSNGRQRYKCKSYHRKQQTLYSFHIIALNHLQQKEERKLRAED